MNKKILTGITSCALAAMTLCTGAAAQSVSQDGMAVIGTENTSFSNCVEQIRSVYTDRYPEQVDVVNTVIDEVTSNKIFLEYYEYESKTALRILENALTDALTPPIEPYSYNGTVAWTDYEVPKIAQVENNYCGPAAVQMALIGSGLWANNTDNKSESKQRDIASAMGVGRYGVDIAIVTNYMNKYYSSSSICQYESRFFISYSVDKVVYYLSDSLRGNQVPIIMIPNTKYLEYYDGYSCTHFIVVKKVDTLNKTLTIVDPFHNDSMDALNKKCFGEHTLTFDQLYNVVNNCGVFVSAYTYV